MPASIGVHSHIQGTTASTTLVTPAVTTQAANSTFVIAPIAAGTSNITAVADSKSNAYSQIQPQFNTSFGSCIQWFRKENGTGGASHTSTTTLGTGQVATAYFVELLGTASSGVLDQSVAFAADASSPFTTSTTGTTTQVDSIALAFYATDTPSGTETITWGNGFAQIDADGNSAFVTGGIAFLVLSALQTVTGSITSSVATDTAGAVATFKALATSSTPAPMMPTALKLGGSGLPRFTPPSGGAGPVQYLQSVAGMLNFAGGLVKQVGKLAAGSVNFAGALVKQVNKIVAGSVNFAGAFAATRVVLLAVSGSVGFTGALTKRALKNTAGSVNFAGGLVKQTNKLVAGTVNFAGGLIKQVGKLLGGTVNFSGALATTKVVLLSLSGTVGFSGGLTKQTNKIVAGSVNFAGACKKGVAHAVSGTVNFSGGLLKQVNKITAGVVSFAGSLATLKIPGGTTFTQAVGGTLSFIGTVATSKIPFGAVVSDWIMRIRRRRR